MKSNLVKQFICFFLTLVIMTNSILNLTEVSAFPAINVEFDSNEQSVIVSGVPESDSTGAIYELRGYMYYQDERIETFCYAPSAYPYHVADRQAYIFNWVNGEFLLPCSGDYQFTAYLVKVSGDVAQEGPKTTITIHLTKKDESTNWGPGLPNTTIEVYDLNEIKKKDKNIVIEEEGYSWIINGQDIETVPEDNLSLAITQNSEDFPMNGANEFFGDSLAHKLSIEHDGEFGFKATLNYTVGTEYTGKYANLFYVVGDGTFEFVEGGIVDENGMISYTFTHASDYIIAITDTEYTGQKLNQQTEEPVKDTEMEVVNSEDTTTIGADVDTDDTTPSPLILVGALIIIITVAVAIYIKQKKK